MYDHEYAERTQKPLVPLRPVVMPPYEHGLVGRMKQYLEQRNLSHSLALDNGWYPTMDYDLCPRVVIPASSLANSWPYYQARLMIEAHSSIKRYVSPSAPRGDALAVVFPNIGPKTPYPICRGVVIVEGPMDALAAAGLGYVGIGLMGNTPNDAVLNHIEEIVKTFGTCIIIPDRDAEEQGIAVTAKLWARGVRCTLKRITGAKDLAELDPERRRLLLA